MLSSEVLNFSKDRDATTSLGDLFQSFSTLTANFFANIWLEFPLLELVPLDSSLYHHIHLSLALASLQPHTGVAEVKSKIHTFTFVLKTEQTDFLHFPPMSHAPTS